MTSISSGASRIARSLNSMAVSTSPRAAFALARIAFKRAPFGEPSVICSRYARALSGFPSCKSSSASCIAILSSSGSCSSALFSWKMARSISPAASAARAASIYRETWVGSQLRACSNNSSASDERPRLRYEWPTVVSRSGSSGANWRARCQSAAARASCPIWVRASPARQRYCALSAGGLSSVSQISRARKNVL